jgi:alanine dehydrogenase
MANSSRPLTFGLPRMHKEEGERRDFLPELVEHLAEHGCEVFVETGIGSGMGLADSDYTSRSARVHAVDNAEAFRQDVVLALRSPELDEFQKLVAGATLISMLHFPTRPRRIRRLLGLGVDAIGLDSIVDDDGRRLVENMRAVAWNGVEAGFTALEQTAPERLRAKQPLRATVMGSGLVGKHAIEAATKYGSLERARALATAGAGGVEVTVLGRQLTADAGYMHERLRQTDVLIDATQRSNPSLPLLPNAWIGELPTHATVVDLVVDPYILEVEPRTVRSLEGIPRGTLDKFIFMPDDPAWDDTVPPSIASAHRRATATCYSWPGVHAKDCMMHYGAQLLPLLDALIRRRDGKSRVADAALERALTRASLPAWAHNSATDEHD